MVTVTQQNAVTKVRSASERIQRARINLSRLSPLSSPFLSPLTFPFSSPLPSLRLPPRTSCSRTFGQNVSTWSRARKRTWKRTSKGTAYLESYLGSHSNLESHPKTYLEVYLEVYLCSLPEVSQAPESYLEVFLEACLEVNFAIGKPRFRSFRASQPWERGIVPGIVLGSVLWKCI